ncbi:cytochrome c biogenesis heme-transporting ATPase CcmA [Rhizobacter sp. Root404]|uniref:cytochrome c biogenesis heme-transporting ATPase CcmA n=1 Tax=Rhizobacter sp. Root404 TaxID=1736528 RepID=UPI0009E9FFED|nr:cytochrome c biogenesis heme-transporting ATPase CcmA [Rhizobacter sp. Root404]
MNAALELRDLRCVRGQRVLFSGLSASVRAGQMLRVQGENGAGKTSLLRMVCGLASPDHGEVLWQGRSIARLREEFNLQLVYLGHAPALKDDLSALENLLASGGLAGLACSEQAAAGALAQAGLRTQVRLPARVLSQGQRKRVGLARLALSTAAALWVLDEPFSALDEVACAWLQGLIGTQLGRGGVVVMTSHQGRSWDAAQPQVALTLQPPRSNADAQIGRMMGMGR